MYEVDKERLLEIFRVIEENLGYIEDVKIESIKKNKKHIRDYYFVSMALFTILNKILEIAEEFVDFLDVKEYPTKYVEFFEILYANDVITEELFNKMKVFVEYRNDIAHEYNEIRDTEIIWCIKNLKYLKDFMKVVKKQLLE